jgi:hypothetical protein
MALLLQITWTAPSVTTGILGYNVYLVNGAPQAATKTLLAFVSGANTTTYTSTGVDGQQYQFEVRATDGVNESPALEIFYPTGQALYTPSAITPTGKPMMIPRDTQYLSKDDYLNYPSGLKLTTSSPLYTSGVLDTILLMASGEVNRYTHRHFNVQTIDEVYQGIRIGQDMPKLVTIPLNEGPIQVVNRIDIQVLKWFVNFSLDYLQVFPDQGFIQIVPFLGGTSGVPLPSAMLTEGLLGKVWVNYTFGYDLIPNEVKMATSLFATKMIGLQENPVSAQSVKFGRNFSLTWDRDNDPLIAQAQRLLEPYRVMTWRRP